MPENCSTTVLNLNFSKGRPTRPSLATHNLHRMKLRRDGVVCIIKRQRRNRCAHGPAAGVRTARQGLGCSNAMTVRRAAKYAAQRCLSTPSSAVPFLTDIRAKSLGSPKKALKRMQWAPLGEREIRLRSSTHPKKSTQHRRPENSRSRPLSSPHRLRLLRRRWWTSV